MVRQIKIDVNYLHKWPAGLGIIMQRIYATPKPLKLNRAGGCCKSYDLCTAKTDLQIFHTQERHIQEHYQICEDLTALHIHSQYGKIH